MSQTCAFLLGRPERLGLAAGSRARLQRLEGRRRARLRLVHRRRQQRVRVGDVLDRLALPGCAASHRNCIPGALPAHIEQVCVLDVARLLEVFHVG